MSWGSWHRCRSEEIKLISGTGIFVGVPGRELRSLRRLSDTHGYTIDFINPDCYLLGKNIHRFWRLTPRFLFQYRFDIPKTDIRERFACRVMDCWAVAYIWCWGGRPHRPTWSADLNMHCIDRYSRRLSLRIFLRFARRRRMDVSLLVPRRSTRW